MKLSQRILALRKQHNLSQEQLASKMGVTRQTISRWESELSTPDYSNIEKLSEIFGMTVNEFLNIEDQKEAYQEMINQITETQNQQYKTITNYFKYFGVIIILCFGLVGFGMYKLWNKPAQVIVTPIPDETYKEDSIIQDYQLKIIGQQEYFVICEGQVSLNEYNDLTSVSIKVKYNEHVDVYDSEYSYNGFYSFSQVYLPYKEDYSYSIVVNNDGNSKEYDNVSMSAVQNISFYDVNIASYSPLTISLGTIEDSIMFKDNPETIDCYLVNKNQEVIDSGTYSVKKDNDDLICTTDLAITDQLLKKQGEVTLYIRINNDVNVYYASTTFTSKTGLLDPTVNRLLTEKEFNQAIK